MVSMIADPELTAMCSRLARALAPPRGHYRPFRVEGFAAGWLDDARAARLAQMSEVFVVREDDVRFVDSLDSEERRSAGIDRVARELAAAGELTAWRDERYAVAPEFGAEPRFFLERAAARYFGIHTYAAHANGVVRADNGIRMWLARRSATKSIDPGMLDNLVGGGIAAGQSIAETVIKEAWEEAGVPAPLASLAPPAGTVQIRREQRDGLQRETIFVHDLWLPPAYAPDCQDGEAIDHRLVTLDEAAHLITADEGPDAITADASLVIVDFLMRHGQIERDTAAYKALDALRHPAMSFAASSDG
jgi:8-oxo-dGTP pyrophosphatase MutT (NUDIX family)